MPAYIFINDVIEPILYVLAFALISYTWGLAIWRWYQAQRATRQQVKQIAEEYPFDEFYCDLCQYANASYSEDEARGIYEAWQERILTREEEVAR